jgi:hypothetical protein
MKNFKLTFLALSRTTEMEIESENDISLILNDLLMAFAKEIDYENLKINIYYLQQNTEEFRAKINSVIQKYKTFEPKIQQINTYFKDLKDNEYFFIFPNDTIHKQQSFHLFNYLSALQKGEDFEKISKEIDELFGVLMDNYEMFAFDADRKNNIKIGESDKSKRVCRYCNKKSPEVSFKKVAHSISEALGNKKIITNDECDACNEKFGEGIENDLILYLNLYRVFFRIRGKNGIPKLKGKNFEIEIKNEETITIDILSDEEIAVSDCNDFQVRLETTEKITTQNIYKTLSKYALGVIDRTQIVNFKDTIEWINGKKNIDNLPKIAILTSYDLFSTHPKLTVYLRKSKDDKLPYAVAEFRFTYLTFVYIIPNSNKDTTDFTQDNNFEYFWNFFKHYSSIQDWSFQKMNDNTIRPFVMNLNIGKNK